MKNCTEENSLIEYQRLWDIRPWQKEEEITWQSFVLLSLCLHCYITCNHWKQLSPVQWQAFVISTDILLILKNESRLLLTRNWAMSKARSWTKLNRCSDNGVTWPWRGFRSSGDSRTPWLTEHKVTDTTSQHSWATRKYKEEGDREAIRKKRNEWGSVCFKHEQFISWLFIVIIHETWRAKTRSKLKLQQISRWHISRRKTKRWQQTASSGDGSHNITCHNVPVTTQSKGPARVPF